MVIVLTVLVIIMGHLLVKYTANLASILISATCYASPYG